MDFLPVILMALSVSGVAYVLTDMVVRPRRPDPRLGRFEVDRRQRLRDDSFIYRLFEPWVDELAEQIDRNGVGLEETQRHLLAAGVTAPWTAAEYRATRRVEAVFAMVPGFAFGWFLGGWPVAVLGLVGVYFGYQFMAARLLKSAATRRTIKLKRRFASAVDLMALMMEVGAGFQESLDVAAEEARGNPLGDELAIVRRDLSMGKREDALRNFARRTQDDDISEVVLAVIEGEELGTPLAKIFRTQAEQMRMKRTQWAEKASAESEVALVFPAMVIMIACLILVAAPFILTAVYNPGG